MKIPSPLTFVLVALSSVLSLHSTHAGTGHSHATEKLAPGPNGGRIIDSVDPHFEFFLRPDHVAQITFLDDDNQMIPASGQSISMVGGDRSAPVRMHFTRQNGRLVSNRPLPKMKRMPIVLQIHASPSAKKVYEKFYLDLNKCGGCNYQEYACICGH